ncbi:MAG: TIGR03643 family protein [Bacteroidota bacterium]
MNLKKIEEKLGERGLDRVIEMAWEDRTTFDAIEKQFGIPEKVVINLMRRNMKPSSFRMWRKRVQGRSTKHESTSSADRFKCTRQRNISGNKISKR